MTTPEDTTSYNDHNLISNFTTQKHKKSGRKNDPKWLQKAPKRQRQNQNFSQLEQNSNQDGFRSHFFKTFRSFWAILGNFGIILGQCLLYRSFGASQKCHRLVMCPIKTTARGAELNGDDFRSHSQEVHAFLGHFGAISWPVKAIQGQELEVVAY